MLHHTRLERLTSENQSSLLGPSESYEENEVLCIQLLLVKHTIH
jgi:hypothetical protein